MVTVARNAAELGCQFLTCQTVEDGVLCSPTVKVKYRTATWDLHGETDYGVGSMKWGIRLFSRNCLRCIARPIRELSKHLHWSMPSHWGCCHWARGKKWLFRVGLIQLLLATRLRTLQHEVSLGWCSTASPVSPTLGLWVNNLWKRSRKWSKEPVSHHQCPSGPLQLFTSTQHACTHAQNIIQVIVPAPGGCHISILLYGGRLISNYF